MSEEHDMAYDFEERAITRSRAGLRLALGLLLTAGAGTGVGCGDDGDDKGKNNDPQVDGGTDAGGDGDGDASDAGEDAGGLKAATLKEVHSGVVTGIDDLRGLVFSADGKIYASGFVTIDEDPQLAIARFNADGTLDTTFDGDGVATQNLIAAADDQAESNKGREDSLGIVELASGDLIVQSNVNDGEGGRNVVLLKLNSNGAFDGTFGVKQIDFGWPDADLADWPNDTPPVDNSWGIALDNSSGTEKIVVFGQGPAPKGALHEGAQRTDDDRYIVRVLASDGSRDTSFATNGVFSVDIDGARLSDGGRRGAVEPDGAILSAGYTNFGDGLNNHVALIRLLPDGTPDQAFGFGTESVGVTKFNPFLSSGGAAEAYSTAKLSTGRYVTTGYGTSNFEFQSMENDLVSFGLINGGLDTGYGMDGSFAIQSEGDPNAGKGTRPYRENGRDLVRLADDRTLHVGCYDDFAALFMVTKEGALDESFGQAGAIHYTHPTPFFKVAVSPDGKRFAAGTSSGPAGAFLSVLELTEI